MPTVSHASLTADADLHEPKGAAAAAANTVYIADGAGSGSFQNPITALDLVADSNAAINTSFTPVIKFGGVDAVSGGATFSTRTGSYTRVGGIVIIVMRFVFTNKGSGTGDVTIDLPHDNILSGPFTVNFGNVTFGASNAPSAFAATGTDNVLLKTFGTAGHSTSIGSGVLTNTSDIIVYGMYGLAS